MATIVTENMPIVSVITPCYNMEQYLPHYLESVLKQTYHNVQLILVNDGSIDNTAGVIEQYADRLKNSVSDLIVVKKTNAGLAAAVETGLQMATGQYVIWPDPDDFMEPTLIEALVEFLTKHPSYDLVRCDVREVADGGEMPLSATIGSRRGESRFDENLFDSTILETGGYWLVPGAYMVRRSALIKAIPSLKIFHSRRGQNWQLLLPVMHKSRCGYIDKALHNYRLRPNSISRSASTLAHFRKRLDDCEEILIHTITGIEGVDLKKYLGMVRVKYLRRRLQLALRYMDPLYAAETIAECEKAGVCTRWEKMKVFIIRYKYGRIVIRTVRHIRNWF